MKLSYLIGAIVAVTAILLGGLYAWDQKLHEPMHMDMSSHATSSMLMAATVKYTEKGFVPNMITLKQGGTVTFESMTGSDIWVASGEHANHAQYSGSTEVQHCPDTTGTAFDQCAPGKSFSFTFKKIGDWDYHNHLKEEDTGMVTVVQ